MSVNKKIIMSGFASSEAWKATNSNSEIYTKMNEFRDIIYKYKQNSEDNEIEKVINSLIDNGDLDNAILFLNEYEIQNGTNNNIYHKYESKVDKLYSEGMLQNNIKYCKFIDNDINSSNNLDIKHFKDIHKGERCFIIGNGPSLNKIDLSKLKNEITFGVNSIFLNYDNMGFYPTYYTVEDFHVINERSQEIKNIVESIKFMPKYSKEKFGDCNDFIYLNVIPDYRRYSGYPYFSTDIERRVWTGGTVSYINIQLAYYMGFKYIILIGFDHNYIIPKSAKISGTNIISQADDPNHFHPNYFGKGYSWHIPLTERMELCYIKSKYACNSSGISIFNATYGGKLEIFPRLNYETLINNIKKQRCVVDFQKNRHKYFENNQDQFDISVIIASYNSARTISKALESLIAQSNIRCEILVIDDGSDDVSKEIIKKFAEKFTNIRLICQKHQGQGCARNLGIEQAKADLITFLDSDDQMNSNILSDAIQIQKIHNCDILQFDFERISNGKDIKNFCPALKKHGCDGLHFVLLGKTSLSPWARIYKKSLLRNNNIKFSEGCCHEDIIFVAKSYYFAESVIYIDIKGYQWFCNENSTTSKFSNFHVVSMKQVIHEIEAFLKEENIFEKLETSYNIFCYKMINLLIERSYTINNPTKRLSLLRQIRKTIEELSLDDQHKIQCAKMAKFKNIEQLFLRLFDTNINDNIIIIGKKDTTNCNEDEECVKKRESRNLSEYVKNDSKNVDISNKESKGSLKKDESSYTSRNKKNDSNYKEYRHKLCEYVLMHFVSSKKLRKFSKDPYKFYDDAPYPFKILKFLFRD